MRNVKYHDVILITVSALIGISVFMLLTFVHSRVSTSEQEPFRMSFRYKTLQKTTENKVVFDDVINLENDKNVLVVTYNRNQDYIGVYDPMMTLAFENIVVLPGATRYFSELDYANKTKSGIIVNFNDVFDLDSCKRVKHPLVDDVMYCTDNQSAFSTIPNVTTVINLASLQDFGELVYIDGPSDEAVETIVTRLQGLGYTLQPKQRVGMVAAVLNAHKDRLASIMAGGILLYGVFAVVVFWHFFHRRKELTLHYLHGGTQKTVFHNLGKNFMILSFIGMIPIYLVGWFLSYQGISLMENQTLYGFLFMHLLITCFCYRICFNMIFKIIESNERGTTYVR